MGFPASAASIRLVVSYAVWAGQNWNITEKTRAALGMGCVIFAGHVGEEYTQELHHTLPALFGLDP